MKTLIFTASQENTSINFTFEISNGNESRVLGTLLNELFAWCTLQQTVGAKGLKFSQPIDLAFECGGLTFDTTTVRRELVQKLKLNKTAKAKRAFAQRFKAIFDYSISEVRETTFADLLESLAC